MSSASSMSSTEISKRKPGRPPLKAVVPTMNRVGVVSAPKFQENKLEFVYDDPSVFKNLFTYYKNLGVSDIHLRCDPNSLTFFARATNVNACVVTKIDGKHINWYYCSETYWIGISRVSFAGLFASIDASFTKITISQNMNEIDTIRVIFDDREADKYIVYQMTTSNYDPDEELYYTENIVTPEASDIRYPLQFRLTSKQFKKSIADATHHTTGNICYVKSPGHHLQMRYDIPGISYSETFKNPEKISLVANIADDEMFRCNLSVMNVKCIANSIVTDEIYLLCREDSDVLFRSILDGSTIVVNTVMKIN